MKKILSFLLIFTLLFTLTALVGCGSASTTFPAVIRYVGGDHFIVEGLPENDVNHTWAFQFSIDESVPIKEKRKTIDADDLEVGDVIEITYTGSVLEISPAIIENVVKLERTATRTELGDKYPATYNARVIDKDETRILVTDPTSRFVGLVGTYELPIDEVENAFHIGVHDYVNVSCTGEIVTPEGDAYGRFENITAVEITEHAGSGTVFEKKDGYIHVRHSTMNVAEDVPIYHKGKRISLSDIHIGDKIVYWYDGMSTLSYPGRLGNVYRIELLEEEISPSTSEFAAYIEEIDGKKITVKGDPQNTDPYFHERFTFTLTEDTPLYGGMYGKLEFPLGVGDRIRIVWSGTTADLTPIVIDHVVMIHRWSAANPPQIGLHLLSGVLMETGKENWVIQPIGSEELVEIPIMDETKFIEGVETIERNAFSVGDLVMVRYEAPICDDPFSYLMITKNIEKLASPTEPVID